MKRLLAAALVFASLPLFAEDAATRSDIPPLAVKLPPAPPKPKPKAHKDDEVVVRVNGRDITWGSINRYADMMAALLKNKSPKIDAAKLKKFKEKNLKSFSDTMFWNLAVTTCLENSNVVVSAAIKEDVEKEFLRNYGARKQTLDQLRAILEKQGFLADIEDLLAKEALIMSFVTTVYSNEYYVSDAKIAEVKADVAAFNERADATNAVNLATAREVAERARAGEDFAALADKYSQDPEKAPGGALGECVEGDFADDAQVWRALSSMKAGDVTGAIETEDGYAVYKVVARKSAEESNSDEDSLEVSRIFFRRAYRFPPQSDEEFRADVESELRSKLLKDIVSRFIKQSAIERPNGIIDSY